MVTEKLKLYVSKVCPYCQRVEIAFKELGIDFDRVEIDLRDKPADFKDISPDGKVPVLQYKSKTLVESALICQFLNDEFSPETLIPTKAYDKYLVGRLVLLFQENVVPFYYDFLRAQETEKQHEFRTKLLAGLEKINGFLLAHGSAEGPYLLGDRFSLAEVLALPWFVRMPLLKQIRNFEIPDTKNYQRVKMWAARGMQRDSVKQTTQPMEVYVNAYNEVIKRALHINKLEQLEVNAKFEEIIVQQIFTEDFTFERVNFSENGFLLRRNAECSEELLKRITTENKLNDTDLIPGVYEGGFKTWECATDLLEYISRNSFPWSSTRVLELGCGSGLPGIYAALQGASAVHFQDYNRDVIASITIPNLKENLKRTSSNIDNNILQQKYRFFSGDWDEFSDNAKGDLKYDLIIASEIIYNLNYYPKLTRLFDTCLSLHGKILLAAKRYYFGVGGGTSTFQEFINLSGIFQSKLVYSVENNVCRDMLEITRRHVK